MQVSSRSIWRLIDSGTIAPPLSAALDESILDARNREAVPNTLHFYSRNRPTVSIGQNERVEQSVNLEQARKRGVFIIRRCSGGSAVYMEGGQLIFAAIIHRSDLPNDIMKSYEVACGAIVAGLKKLGLEASHKPINDILIDGRKVSGSAQLRRGNAVLHHATLIIDLDLEAVRAVLRPKNVGEEVSHNLVGIGSLMDHEPGINEVKDAIAQGFSEKFNAEIVPGELIAEEIKRSDKLVTDKYGRDEWNFLK